MPLLGPVPEGGTFFCPHCGAMYSVTLSRLPKTVDRHIAKCVVCRQIMESGIKQSTDLQAHSSARRCLN